MRHTLNFVLVHLVHLKLSYWNKLTNPWQFCWPSPRESRHVRTLKYKVNASDEYKCFSIKCFSIKVRLVGWNWTTWNFSYQFPGGLQASISNKKTAMITFSAVSDKKGKSLFERKYYHLSTIRQNIYFDNYHQIWWRVT